MGEDEFEGAEEFEDEAEPDEGVVPLDAAADAEADYYASPERGALPDNPADHIDVMHIGMVRVEKL